MAGPWSITNRATVGQQSSASQAAPASGAAQGMQNRIRALGASLNGTTAGTAQLVVRDGPATTGTIIWQWDLSVPTAGTGMAVSFPDLDLRATPGNSITIEFVAGVGGDFEAVNAVGDIIPVGYPMFQS